MGAMVRWSVVFWSSWARIVGLVVRGCWSQCEGMENLLLGDLFSGLIDDGAVCDWDGTGQLWAWMDKQEISLFFFVVT